ncbi:flagellar motor protein PomA [Dasania marina]|uniref:flagellar motor protein PomA n=1 Tax=Dasania marina TaxID=471499 RepID=UPI0004777DF8|nr:flagellar motor protein PomA [Dasania marina]
MDLATLIGMAGAMVIIITAMALSGGVLMFVDIPSVLIVIVGSIFVVMSKFGLSTFLGAGKVAAKAFMFKSSDPAELIDEIVELADVARKGGLLSLEGKEVSNDFLQDGIQLLVDGHDPEVVKDLLGKDMNKTVERHEIGSTIFSALGDVAPAMGMIGTLVGLVAMLSNMDDPKSIGPAMAVALLTTLYGAMLANMVAIPISDKLNLRRGEESMIKSLVIDALLAIQGGQNPRVIDSMLRNYLPSSKRGSADDE